MGIAAPTALTTGTAAATATPATASVSPAANSFVIVTMYAHTAGGTNFTDTATCAGHASTTWTKRGASLSADGKQYLVQFTAQQASYTASAITVTLNTAATEVRWTVTQYAVTSSTLSTSAYVTSGAGTLAAGTSQTFSPTAATDTDNAQFAAWGHKAAEATTVGSGWTELSDLTGTAIGLETQYAPAGVQGAASWTTSAVSIYAWVELSNGASSVLGELTAGNLALEADTDVTGTLSGNGNTIGTNTATGVAAWTSFLGIVEGEYDSTTTTDDGDGAPGGGPTGTWAGVT